MGAGRVGFQVGRRLAPGQASIRAVVSLHLLGYVQRKRSLQEPLAPIDFPARGLPYVCVFLLKTHLHLPSSGDIGAMWPVSSKQNTLNTLTLVEFVLLQEHFLVAFSETWIDPDYIQSEVSQR